MSKSKILETLRARLQERQAVLSTYKGQMNRSGAHFVKGEIHAIQWAIHEIEQQGE